MQNLAMPSMWLRVLLASIRASACEGKRDNSNSNRNRSNSNSNQSNKSNHSNNSNKHLNNSTTNNSSMGNSSNRKRTGAKVRVPTGEAIFWCLVATGGADKKKLLRHAS